MDVFRGPLLCQPHHSIISTYEAPGDRGVLTTKLIISSNHSTPSPTYPLLSFLWLSNINSTMHFLSNSLLTRTTSSSKGKQILECCVIKSSSRPRIWSSLENSSPIARDNCRQCITWSRLKNSLNIVNLVSVNSLTGSQLQLDIRKNLQVFSNLI